jgi:hypothetical protein
MRRLRENPEPLHFCFSIGQKRKAGTFSQSIVILFTRRILRNATVFGVQQ